jgi:hypothetical protein
MTKRHRSAIKSAKGLKLATKLHRICELAGYKATLVNVWHNGAGTGICLPDGTLAFIVTDPRCTDDFGPKFLGFVFIEPCCEVSFFGPQLGAQEELRSIFEDVPTDVWSMTG